MGYFLCGTSVTKNDDDKESRIRSLLYAYRVNL